MIKKHINITKLEEALGYSFKEESLIERALTLAYGKKSGAYERLEFLGDRVLGLTIAELLFKKFKKEDEGDLAKRFTALVKEGALAFVAKELSLGQFLITNEEELRQNDSVLSDVTEAIMAVIFLESGFETVHDIIERLWKDSIEKYEKPPQDAKTTLQEYAQKKKLPLPTYKTLEKRGSDHEPVFVMSVSVKGFPPLLAEGSNKRAAEQAAAKVFLTQYVLKDNNK
ncbi:MAG: ribonuclease III [Alphaproteobacteria bacterium]|nr:ribonuclease III [Alphaproteobacteria bacterium]NCB49510.1 ribonuclease III [Alphaproteobacteria bacterium]